MGLGELTQLSLKNASQKTIKKAGLQGVSNLTELGHSLISSNKVCVVMCLHCFSDHSEENSPALFKSTSLLSKKPILKLYLEKLVYLVRTNQSPPFKIFAIVNSEYYQDVHLWVLEHCTIYRAELEISIFRYTPTIPNLGRDGQVLFEDANNFSFSYGQGDLLLAMKNLGILNTIKQSTYEYVWFADPQNLLQKPCDPLLLGLMAREELQAAAKVSDVKQEDKTSRNLYAVSTARQQLTIRQLSVDSLSSSRQFLYHSSVVLAKDYLCNSLYSSLKEQANLNIETRELKVIHYDTQYNKSTITQEPNALVFSRTPKDFLVSHKNNKVRLLRVSRAEECYWLRDTKQPETVLSNYFKTFLLGIEGTNQNELVQVSPLLGWNYDDQQISQIREKLKIQEEIGFPLEIKQNNSRLF